MYKLLLIFLGMLTWLSSTQPLGVNVARDWLRRGYAAYQRGEYGDAEVSFRRALAANPRFAEARYNLGLALYQQQRYGEALQYFRQSEQNLPANQRSQLFYNQGNTLLKLNRLPQAAAAYRQSLRLRPSYVPAQKNLSYVLARLNQKNARKDVLRHINQMQKQLIKNAESSKTERKNESSEKPTEQQASSASKNQIQSPQEQLNTSEMETMLKQLDQAEKQIRGRRSGAKAEKSVKKEEKDW